MAIIKPNPDWESKEPWKNRHSLEPLRTYSGKVVYLRRRGGDASGKHGMVDRDAQRIVLKVADARITNIHNIFPDQVDYYRLLWNTVCRRAAEVSLTLFRYWSWEYVESMKWDIAYIAFEMLFQAAADYLLPGVASESIRQFQHLYVSGSRRYLATDNRDKLDELYKRLTYPMPKR